MSTRYTLLKRVGIGLLASMTALTLLLGVTLNVFANTVNIYDNAGVLNQSQVRQEASSLPYPVSIYTVNGFNGSEANFDTEARSKVTSDNLIVIAINTAGHVYITGGRSVPLTTSDYQQASNTFASDMRNNGRNFTDATVGALNSLRGALGSRSAGSGGAVPAPGGLFGVGNSLLCCIGLLVLAGILFFAFMRRRARPGFGGFFNRNRGVPPYGPNQPYGPNPPYPPNYGPGYNQGMNPWAAGGLGAAAGGFLGYELGKEQGERQAEEGFLGGQSGNLGGGGSGGGAGADWGGGDSGGGAGADWGGGNGDPGAGSDFGGSGSDWGSSGGDAGGGSGSNF